MAANINSIMYVGETPWHGLGTKLNEAPTSADAIKAAGLDWDVRKVPVEYHDGRMTRKAPGHNVVIRSDNGDTLGVVGDVYTALQNRDAFKFFDAVVGEKAAMYHTAGALGLGERVWILAKLPGYIRVVGDDITEKFLLLTNSHDGSGSVKVLFTPIRVVCQNTLNIALRSDGKISKVRHSAAMGGRIQNVRDELGIIGAKFSLFEEAARKLATVQVTQEAFKAYVDKAGLVDMDAKTTRAQNIMDEVSALFEGRQKGGRWDGVRGTAWGAFNAVSEYVDFHRSTRSGGMSGDMSRATSLLFGSGATIKQKAWDEALNLIAR